MFLSYATAPVFVLTILLNFFCLHSLPVDTPAPTPPADAPTPGTDTGTESQTDTGTESQTDTGTESQTDTGTLPTTGMDFDSCDTCLASDCHVTSKGVCIPGEKDSHYMCYSCETKDGVDQYFLEIDCSPHCLDTNKKCVCQGSCYACVVDDPNRNDTCQALNPIDLDTDCIDQRT